MTVTVSSLFVWVAGLPVPNWLVQLARKDAIVIVIVQVAEAFSGFGSSRWKPASVHTRSLGVCLRSCLAAVHIDLVAA